MFDGAREFNQDLSNWDVSNVTSMCCMFCDAESFNQDLSSWDVSNVENMDGMFDNCNIKEEYKPDISNWYCSDEDE